MRLDGVEIKVSLGKSQVARAVEVLRLARGKAREVSFLEDTTVGTGLPLFRHGVVLRVRKDDDGDEDTTVKLRPCRRSQLVAPWLDKEEGDGFEVRVEEDWASSRRSLAASCVADLPAGRIASVRDETASPGQLFVDGQRAFLSDCGGLPVNLDALTLLPAVAATRWKDVRVGAVEEVVAERWVVGDLDFLELSIREDTATHAVAAQEKLEQELSTLGLERDDAESKTAQVLEHLVGSDRR